MAICVAFICLFFSVAEASVSLRARRHARRLEFSKAIGEQTAVKVANPQVPLFLGDSKNHESSFLDALRKLNDTRRINKVKQLSSGNYGLVWIHGAGFYDWQPQMDWSLKTEQHNEALTTSYPRAPTVRVTAWGQYAPEGVSWYDMKFLPIGSEDSPPGYGCSLDDAKDNLPIIHNAIDEMVKSGVPASNIVVAGMSQGGYMTLRAALTYPEKLGGAFVYAGMLMYPDELKQQLSPQNKDLPIEWLHGTNDDVLFLSMQDAGVSELRSMGFTVTKSTCSAKHQTDPALYERLGAFLDRVMGDQHVAQDRDEDTKTVKSASAPESPKWLCVFCFLVGLLI